MTKSRKVKWITTIAIVLVLFCFAFFYYRSTGSYLPAWFSILVLALMILLSLSIPRYISITQTSLEIHCVLEITAIPMNNIKNIEAIDKRDMKWCIPVPLLGIWGVFGFYGYYFDLKNLRLFKMYASYWEDFILIEDIYEEIIVVNHKNRDEIIAQIERQKL